MPPNPPSPAPSGASSYASRLAVVALAFGRHPAWPGEIEGVGLADPALTEARRIIYTEGVARAPALIEQIPAPQRLPRFAHGVLVHAGAGVCVGRLWAGRGDAPMGVLMRVAGVDPGWAAEACEPRLRGVERTSAETRSPELVRLSVGEATRQIEDSFVMSVGPARAAEPDERLRAELARSPASAALVAKLAALLAESPRGVHARLPAALGPGTRSARAWASIVRELAPSLPVAVLAPDGAAFVDVFVGHCPAESWARVRADEGHAPVLEPADTTPEALARAQAILRPRPGAPSAAPRSDTDDPSRARRVVAVGGLLAAIVGAGLIVNRCAERPAPTGDPKQFVRGEPPADVAPPPITEPAAPGQLNAVLRSLESVRAELRAQGTDVDPEVDRLAREAAADPRRTADLERAVDAETSRAAANVLAWTKSRPAPTADLAGPWAQALTTINPRAGMEAARADVSRLHEGFEAVAAPLDALRKQPGEEVARASGPLAHAWADRAAVARRGAERLLAQGRTHGALALLDAERAWRERAVRTAEAVNGVDAMLRDGRTPEEVGDRTTRAWGAALAESVPEALAAAQRAAAALEDLRGIGSEESIGTLLARIDSAALKGTDASGARRAWARLAEIGWPATPEQFDAARSRAEQVASMAGGEGSRAATAAMWRAYVDRPERTEDELLAALDAGSVFGVGDAVPPPRIIFAGAKRSLGRDLDRGVPARDAAAAFLSTIGDAAAHADAAHTELIRLARAVRDEREGMKPLARLGPGAAGWTLAEASEDRAALAYEFAGVRMAFRRVGGAAAAGANTTYLATAELPVSAIVRAQGSNDAVRDALATLRPFLPGAADPREGPRVWEWTDASRRSIRVCARWLREPLGSAVGDAPSPNSPMLDVPFETARAIAAAFGCRLPTESEWRSAAQDATEGAPNLRDDTWDANVRAVLAAARKVGRPEPDLDACAASRAPSAASDGAAWPTPVDAGARHGAFVNLIGNAAEWVTADDGSPLVAGGSALGGGPSVAAPPSASGLCDVGFRLIFDAPADAPVRPAEDALRRALGPERRGRE